MSDRPLVIAHRGASAGAVDNSLDAFARAIEVGSDMIEFDVRRTGDDKLIVLHDAEADGRPIASLTYADVARSLGREPPLLEEVLELAKGRIGLDVELKEDGYVEQAMSALAAHVEADEMIVTSFLDRVLAKVKQRRPDLTTGLLLALDGPKPDLRTRTSEVLPMRRIRACGADFVAMHHELAGLGALGQAHSAGYPGIVWTVNDDHALQQLLADERVYGVITDVPERALELRAGASRS